jgi:hypothetical protein
MRLAATAARVSSLTLPGGKLGGPAGEEAGGARAGGEEGGGIVSRGQASGILSLCTFIEGRLTDLEQVMSLGHFAERAFAVLKRRAV